jgi:hypothetical protein
VAEEPRAPEPFRLTYSTMFDPPVELHQRFDAAQARVRTQLGNDHPMWIAGQARGGAEHFEVRSPIDRDLLLARFPRGSAADAADAVSAAVAAYPAWAATPWPERVRILLRAAELIEQRVYDISAAVALEIGKNRMESLGEVQETADLVRWYCEQMQANEGFDRVLPDDPLPGFRSHNRTRLRPYGAWAVIAPFNFPFALAGGPIGAALVAGNSVVFKVASDTAWSGVLLMQAFHEAGVPATSALRWPPTRASPASPSPARTASAWAWCGPSRSRPGRGRASSRWVARMPPSSAAMPTWSALPPASCARPSACRGRSVRPARGCMSSARWRRHCVSAWWR